MRRIRSVLRHCLNWVGERPILFGFLSMTLFMLIGFVALLVAVRPLQTRFSYDQEVFMPLENVLCPGELLRVPISGVTSGERTVTSAFRSIHPASGIVGKYLFTYPPMHIATSSTGGPFSSVVVTKLPDDIPTGYYKITTNTSQNNLHNVNGFDAFFWIIDCGPTGSST